MSRGIRSLLSRIGLIETGRRGLGLRRLDIDAAPSAGDELRASTRRRTEVWAAAQLVVGLREIARAYA